MSLVYHFFSHSGWTNFQGARQTIVKKKDYIKKAIEDTKTGLTGEKLVLEFEKNRLIDIGLHKKVPEIKWVSEKSDSYGYDILSYDLINGKIVERYIEVKATKSSKIVIFSYLKMK